MSYERLGDLLQALGQGDAARQYYQQALEIAQRLVAAEPDRADYQRDLSVSYERAGRPAPGPGPRGRGAPVLPTGPGDSPSGWSRRNPTAPTTSAICRYPTTSWATCSRPWAKGTRRASTTNRPWRFAQRLVAAEPDRADYQRDLSVSYEQLGDLLQALGQGDAARQYYQQALEIAQRLVAAEPDRADYQWDLVVSLLRMAAVEPDNSTEHRTRALAILRDLHATDRLFPEQERLMRELEQELRTED